MKFIFNFYWVINIFLSKNGKAIYTNSFTTRYERNEYYWSNKNCNKF